MPSPPRRSAPPTTRSRRPATLGVVEVDRDRARRAEQHRGRRRRETVERGPGARDGRGRAHGRALGRRAPGTAPARGRRARRRRPAVLPVGVDERAAACVDASPWRRRPGHRRTASRAAGAAQRLRPRRRARARPPRRPTRTASEQLVRLGRPRQQLAVEQQPVGLELVPQPGRRRARVRSRSSSSPLERRSAKNGRPVRVLDRARPRPPRCRTARSATVGVAADDDDRPRAHVLLLAHTTCARRRAGSRRTPRPGARAGPSLATWPAGAMVGGR